eukprot:6441329-Alexandrium_andersonii.AAC.1
MSAQGDWCDGMGWLLNACVVDGGAFGGGQIARVLALADKTGSLCVGRCCASDGMSQLYATARARCAT